MREPPDRKLLLALHDRLRGGDRVASEELSRLLLPRLQEEIARQFPRADEHMVMDGVIDALFDYYVHPQQFDAGRHVPLDRFLATAARCNVGNLLRGERRRKHREQKVSSKKRELDVALDPVAGNIRQEELKELEERRTAMLEALDDPKDKQILALRLEGVRGAADAAQVLEITHLPLEQQRREVKRHKDRIIRFLRRKGLLP